MRLESTRTRTLLGGATMLLAILPALSLSAQKAKKDTTMNRTVVVEQQYNPTIMDAQKVNVLPEVKELTSTPNEVEYDRTVAPATVLPGTAMAAYAGEEKQQQAKQGYLRLGYGSFGNLDVEGNYLFSLSPKDKLNLSLGVQGMDGDSYYPYGNTVNGSDDWDSRFYRTKAGIDYAHQFKTMEMNIGGNFGLSNFNYMPEPTIANPRRQRLTSGDGHIGLKSTDESLPMQFSVETGVYVYGREYTYFMDSHDETMVRTKGDFTGEVTEGQHVGVAFEMNNMFYGAELYDKKFEDYTALSLKPYYEWAEEGLWKLHAGVNVDLAFGYGKKLRVAPDVRAEYIISDSYVLYANATGGQIVNDFRRLEQLNPYGQIRHYQPLNSHEQLNALLGFKMSPATGLWFNIYGGYQKIKDDLVATTDVLSSATFAPAAYFNGNTSNFFAGLQTNYAYKDVFNFMVKGQYYNWDADDEFTLQYKPQFRFDTQIGVRPIPALGVNLGYEFIKRETIYSGAYRAGNISNLNLSATYDLWKGVSIYARFSNLLSRKVAYYESAAIPGANFLGGFIFSF